jgi:hypothetical protein
MSLKQLWTTSWQAHDRLIALTLCGRLAIPLVVLGVVSSVSFWRAVQADTDVVRALQVDYEDSALCAKFGFPTGSDKHIACKLDLLDLRIADEKLVFATSLP